MGCISSHCYNSHQDLIKYGSDAQYIDKISYKIKAYVVSVYDGDTFTSAIETYVPNNGKFNRKVVRVKCRLLGIDTPEMKPPKNQDNRDQEIAKAREAKKYVESCILNKLITLDVSGTDKYGRYLVSLFIPNTKQDLTDSLISNGHGYRYDGGTKQKFTNVSV